ncbi:MAG: acyl carrier protein [Acidobacteriota bacterium]
MPSIEETIRQIIVERMTLPISPQELPLGAPLFAPASAGGMELDSLSSLEIIGGLSDRYQLPLDDIVPADLQTISTLASYLRKHGVEES